MSNTNELLHHTMSAREVLEAIDSWANRVMDREQVQALWSLLTFLRGPDSGDDDLKYRTTAVVRGIVVPRLASRIGAMYEGADASSMPMRLDDHREINSHFRCHYRWAMTALRDLYSDVITIED